MKLQTELGQALPEFFQESLGFRPVLETCHKIVGITDDNNFALRHFLAPGLHPQVENIVQVYIREQRRSH